jgi:hypothetical protein
MTMRLKVGATYRHVKRGTTYEVLGRAKMQIGFKNLVMHCPLAEVDRVCEQLEKISYVVYRSTGDDTAIWVRPETEFCDGRFVMEDEHG